MIQQAPREHHPVRQGIAATTAIAVAALLLVSGILTLLQGISAVVNDELLVVGPEYIFKLNTTAWGWIHIILGVLLILVAIGMMTGAMWARMTAIFLASLSIVAMFLWLPYYRFGRLW